MRFFVLALSLIGLVACGGSSADVPGSGGSPSPSPDPSGGAAPPPSGGGTGAATPDAPDPGGPRVSIVMRGSTDPFTHADGFAGETPRKQILAVRSLWLLRKPDDPNPVKVFDLGAASVEAELVSGKPTELAKVAARSLPAGVFTMAKAGAAYVRYAVDARLHTPEGAFDGWYDNVQALSDGAVIDGATQKKGHFRYSFVTGGATVGTLEGENAPTPVATTTGGIQMDMSGPETFYVFPVELAVDPNVTKDVTVEFAVNVNESFRWQDQSGDGYTKGVFDTTPSQFEPVMAFGANAFTLTVSSD